MITIILHVFLLTCVIFFTAGQRAGVACAQPPAKPEGWEIFASVKFISKYYKQYKQYFLTPLFDVGIRSREGSEIVLSGHYMPLDLADKKTIIISKFPFAACFFCGGAGPESVAEVQLSVSAPRIKADQVITVKGKLRLNDSDVEHLNFILTDARLIQP